MNQAQVSEKIGVSQPHLSQVLNGDKRFSWQTAKRIASLFENLSAATLMDATPAELRKIFGVDNGS